METRKLHIPRFVSLIACVFLLVLTLAGLKPRLTSAQASGFDVVASVNQLRAANGLPPYQINASLMAAAQSHSEYMASSGSVTHSGAGGSRAADRALAAGYSGGQMFVSENIAAGFDWGAQDAVQAWQGDSLHLDTMLSPNYSDAGAGVAVSGHTVYFTLVAGSTDGGTGGGSSSAQRLPDVTIYPQFTPVDTATPQPDGSIVHTVQQGQALWNIAAFYGIDPDQLLELNNITENTVLFPGDTLVVKPPNATPTPTPPATVTPFPATATPIATSTPTPLSPQEVALTETAYADFLATQTPPASVLSRVVPSAQEAVVGIIGVLVIGGMAFVIVGSVLNRFG